MKSYLIPVFLSHHMKNQFHSIFSKCLHNLTTFHHYYISTVSTVGPGTIISSLDHCNSVLTAFSMCPFKSLHNTQTDLFLSFFNVSQMISFLCLKHCENFHLMYSKAKVLKMAYEILHDLPLKTIYFYSSFSLYSSQRASLWFLKNANISLVAVSLHILFLLFGMFFQLSTELTSSSP